MGPICISKASLAPSGKFIFNCMTSLTLTLSLVYSTMFVSLLALYIRFWPISGATIREAQTSRRGSCFFGSHCTPHDCAETSLLGARNGRNSYLGCRLVEGYYKWYKVQWWSCLLFDGFLEPSHSIKVSFPWQNEIGYPFRQPMCRHNLAGYLSKEECSKCRVGLPHEILFPTLLMILMQNAEVLAWHFGNFDSHNSHP